MTPLISTGIFLALFAVAGIGLAVALSVALLAISNWKHAAKERESL